ncbi:MAG TPA: GNAT family N-acetyltransferase [Xanthobacteraceae bacterium]|nr:GNAT family N-acetyltransferase [Xanthobacteraceae bacterium]
MNDLSGVEQSAQAHMFRLASGEDVTVRAIRPQDAGRLQAYMRNLSVSTRRNRFLGAVNELAQAELDRLTHMSGPGELAMIAFAGAGDAAFMIAEAIQVIAPESQRCEIALSVTDAWQRKGLGALLVRNMECRARVLGARYLIGEVLRTNDAMKGLARQAGFAIRSPFTDARLVAIVKDLAMPQIAAAMPRGFFQAKSIAA